MYAKKRKPKHTITQHPTNTRRPLQRSLQIARHLPRNFEVVAEHHVNLNLMFGWYLTWLNFYLLPVALWLQLTYTFTESPDIMKRGEIPMGRPREGPPVTEEQFKAYVKKQRLAEKKEKAKPKVIKPRNFAEDHVRKLAHDKALG